jgi:hypothetical protein
MLIVIEKCEKVKKYMNSKKALFWHGNPLAKH